ncbi:MAG: O-antigen ligase family protein [Paludibacteraceae bacterium]|nr:O-antigen ligase family protein [Paludibacteraceae bacterium]
MKVKDGRVAIVLFFALFWNPIFFSTCSILGLNFYTEGGGHVPVFMYSYMVVDLIVLYNYVKMLLTKGITKGDMRVYLIVLLFILLYSIKPSECPDGVLLYKVFIAESVPAMLVVSLVLRNNLFQSFIKCLDVLNVIISLGLLMNFPRYLNGNIEFAGGTYQGLSYYAAFSFSINLFYLLWGKEMPRFRLFETKAYYLVSLFLLVVQVVSCFIGGGRGATILMLAAVLLFLFFAYKKSNRFILYSMLVIVAIVVVGIQFLSTEYTAIMMQGYDRAFAYIDQDGSLDMSNTSNRDVIYLKASNAILRQPIIGYGLFAYTDEISAYPHNIILDVLMQGGIIYGIVFFSIMYLIFSRLYKDSIFDSRIFSLWLLVLYTFVNLFFSGSYIGNPLFWFLLGMFVLFNRQRMSLQ